MHQVAVVSRSGGWPEHWKLGELQLHHLTLEEATSDLRVQCITLVEPEPEELRFVLERLEASDRVGAVATVVAGSASSPRVHALMEQCPCDGFLDLSWPEPLAAAALRIAMGHVELGRNVVEIQRAVIDQARQQMASLYDLANHDGLTNLFNQRYFEELMERQHGRSLRRREPYTLVFIDLDDLKLLNTRYGHDGGSRALHELASTIMVSIRSTDVAVRLGGDEFVVLLQNCEQQAGVDFGNRLCARLRELRFEVVPGQLISISVSCGVASFPRDGVAWSELLKSADAALHHSKKQGKNRVTAAEPPPELQSAQ